MKFVPKTKFIQFLSVVLFAIFSFFNIAIADENVDAKIQQAISHAAEGKTKQAAKLIDRIVEEHPNSAKAFFEMGSIYGQRAQESTFIFAAGLAHRSLKGFKQAVELEPENATYRYGLIQFYLSAPGVAGGNKKLAKKHLAVLNELDSKLGFRATAQMLQTAEQKEELTKLYESASQEILQDSGILFDRGMFYQAEERFEEAIADFESIMQLSNVGLGTEQMEFNALYQIGRSSIFSQSNYHRGSEAIQQFIDRAPNSKALPSKDWAHYRLGQIQVLSNQISLARQSFQNALRITNDQDLRKKVTKALKQTKEPLHKT